MSKHLACRRAEDATEWLAGYDPGDGRGLIGDQAASDPFGMFTQDVVIAAFIAGAEAADDLAESEFAVERATGQRRLDDATALMREAGERFREYEAHHRLRAKTYTERLERKRAESHRSAIVRMEDRALDATVKADRNAMMAARLEAWLRGDQLYPITPGGEYVAHTEFRRAGPNVRPVTAGPLSDPDVVEGLMAASGLVDATVPLSVATPTAFRLQTPDPRFDPAQPVLVNGFLYRPATEG